LKTAIALIELWMLVSSNISKQMVKVSGLYLLSNQSYSPLNLQNWMHVEDPFPVPAWHDKEKSADMG